MTDGTAPFWSRYPRSEFRYVLLIIAGAMIIAFFHDFTLKIEPFGDARGYHRIARNLQEGNGYREYLSGSLLWDPAITRGGPAYPFVVAGLYWLLGVSYGSVWGLQILLHGATAWILWLILLRLEMPSSALGRVAAVVLFALNPELLQNTGMLLTEGVFIFLLVCSTWVGLRFIEAPSTAFALGFGIISALVALTRPVALFFFAVTICWVVGLRKKFRWIALPVVAFVLVLAPWISRNYQTYGRVVFVNAAAGYNFWMGNHIGSTGEQGQPRQGDTSKIYAVARSTVEADAGHFLEGIQFVVDHPGEFLSLIVVKSAKFISLVRPSAFWPHLHGTLRAFMTIVMVLWSAVLFIMGIAGMWAVVTTGSWKSKWLLVSALTIAVVPILSVVETRYRFPFYPFLAVFAGVGFEDMRQGKLWHLLFPALLVSGGSLLDLASNINLALRYLQILI